MGGGGRGLHQGKEVDEKIKGYDGLVGWKKEDMCVGVLVGAFVLWYTIFVDA